MADSGVLVLNAGSSSLKFAVFRIGEQADADAVLVRGQVAGIGSKPVFSAAVNGAQADSGPPRRTLGRSPTISRRSRSRSVGSMRMPTVST